MSKIGKSFQVFPFTYILSIFRSQFFLRIDSITSLFSLTLTVLSMSFFFFFFGQRIRLHRDVIVHLFQVTEFNGVLLFKDARCSYITHYLKTKRSSTLPLTIPMPSPKRTSKKLKPSQTVQKEARTSSQDHTQPPEPKPPVIICSDSESSSDSSSDSESLESSTSERDSDKTSSDTLPISNATPDEEAPLPKRKGTVRVIRPGKRCIDPMDKVGRWAVCSIDVQAIEATKLESLENDFEYVQGAGTYKLLVIKIMEVALLADIKIQH
ncbi:hypothetical protein EV360DRAFT_76839 [Lentinula raphanica]|nr:hypothetical protein EV360DRAFT_76839 [Lentinula raphanica]